MDSGLLLDEAGADRGVGLISLGIDHHRDRLAGESVGRSEADENVIESVTLTYDFFELIQ
jgi:hypothetical protein